MNDIKPDSNSEVLFHERGVWWISGWSGSKVFSG